MYCMRSLDLWYSSVPCITDTCQPVPASLHCMRCDGLWYSRVPSLCITDTPVTMPTCTVWVLMVCGTVLSLVSVSLTHLSDCTCLPVLHEVWWCVTQFCHQYHSHTCQTVPTYLYCMRSGCLWHSSVPCLCIADTPVRLPAYLYCMRFVAQLCPFSLCQWHTCQIVPVYLCWMRSHGLWNSSVPWLCITHTPVCTCFNGHTSNKITELMKKNNSAIMVTIFRIF